MGIDTGRRFYFLWNRRHGFGWFSRFFRRSHVCLFTRRGLIWFRKISTERTSQTSRRGLGFGRYTFLGHKLETFLWMGVDDDIVEFSVRPGGFGCHVYFGCDYRCRVLLVETIDGWIPPVSPYSFDPETWHPKPCASPQPEDFEERQQILAEFDAWEDNSGGGSDRQWG